MGSVRHAGDEICPQVRVNLHGRRSRALCLRDGTREVLEQYAERYPNVRLLQHDNNQGYGAALKTGIRKARAEDTFGCSTRSGQGVYEQAPR